jgi:DNA-binding response OmpR family regulator/HPt (histidine-containing phosphotransfer) domain-containing protein
MKILLVDDDQQIAHLITAALTPYSYIVDVATDGQAGWELLESFPYALALLDVMLPKLDGISICRRLRQHRNETPVLLLTARDANTDKIMGLDAGADDYMVKPFDVQELTARIRALLRRGSGSQAPILTWGNLQLDPSSRDVTYGSQKLILRPKEFALLELFLRHKQRVFSRSDILDQLWSFDDFPDEGTVKAHIKGLRQALKKVGAEDLIETLYGQGYRLNPDVLASAPAPPPPQPVAPTMPPPVSDAVVRSTVAQIWAEMKGISFARLAILEQAVQALQAGDCDLTLQQQASQNAHKLAGALGSFGFPVGSTIARDLETLLETITPSAQPTPHQINQMAQLVAMLRQQLATPPTLTATLPRLLVIGSDPATNQDLTTTATDKLQIATVPDCATASTGTNFSPDVVLLTLVADLTPVDRAFLQTGKIPFLIITPFNEVIDRLTLARLGAQAVLPITLPAADVIKAVLRVLQSQQLGAKILAVDDDPALLTLLQTLLSPTGMQVVPLATPMQVWTQLQQTQPDLVLLDIEMPDINGFELCRMIRNDPQWNWLPVLVLTAHTDPETLYRTFEAGADDYVTKPIVAADLIRRVRNRLERTRLLRGQV